MADENKKEDPEFLPNRAGEPEFQMTMTPTCARFACTDDRRPVWCDLKVKNTTGSRQTFKVKCTSADHFRVQPPLGFVGNDETLDIRVWFQNKAPVGDTKHYFAIYHLKCGANDKSVKDLWTKNAKPEGVLRVLAVFDKAAAANGAAPK